MIDGRTESQVKNRFNLILRRELIQKKDHDPEALKNIVIPQIIHALQKRINQGEVDLAAEDSDLGSDNDGENQ